MKVNRCDCNEGWDETKGFLGAKNTPKVPGACFLLEMKLKHIKLQFSLASNVARFVSEKQKMARTEAS